MSAMLCATFATSSKVTAETFAKLNKAAPKNGDYPPKYTNFYNPARRDASKMLKPSETPVDFVVYALEQSPEELYELDENVIDKQVRADGYYGTMAFAILDERSAKDDTVIVLYGDELFDRETGEVTGDLLRRWRVGSADANELVNLIENCGMPVIEADVFEASERFTNQDGVFEFTKAIKVMEGGSSE